MAKRTANTELNHDNWDADDDNEEAGTFNRVSEDELKNRVIRKAKRSLGGSTTSNMLQGSSPFAAFSGFKATSSPFSLTKNSGNSFSGQSPLNKVSENTVKIENGKTEKESEGSTKEAPTLNTQSSKPTRNIEYYRQLQSLNESVLKWMQLHLAKNACSDFTPVFNDYKKHLDTLNVTYPVKKKEETVDKAKSDSYFKTPVSAAEKKEKNVESNGKSGFEVKNAQNDETDYGANFSARTTNTSSFSFGMKSTPTATSSVTPSGPASSSKEEEKVPEKTPFQFSFTAKTDDSTASKGFSFTANTKTDDSTASKGFSFASAIAASAKSSEKGDETEEKDYEPPKNDFVKVEEGDALYSKRCKLFFKKDEAFVDKGVGTLYLKSLEGKTQLLVRADTNLGNILLNIMLSSSLPMSRTGKNNVLLVCVPNPPVDAKNPENKAIPMLIRVKTAEDADELLDALNKHKS